MPPRHPVHSRWPPAASHKCVLCGRCGGSEEGGDSVPPLLPHQEAWGRVSWAISHQSPWGLGSYSATRNSCHVQRGQSSREKGHVPGERSRDLHLHRVHPASAVAGGRRCGRVGAQSWGEQGGVLIRISTRRLAPGAARAALRCRPHSAQRSLLTPAPPTPSLPPSSRGKEEKEERASLGTNKTIPLGPKIKTMGFTLFPPRSNELKKICIAHTLSK